MCRLRAQSSLVQSSPVQSPRGTNVRQSGRRSRRSGFRITDSRFSSLQSLPHANPLLKSLARLASPRLLPRGPGRLGAIGVSEKKRPNPSELADQAISAAPHPRLSSRAGLESWASPLGGYMGIHVFLPKGSPYGSPCRCPSWPPFVRPL